QTDYSFVQVGGDGLACLVEVAQVNVAHRAQCLQRLKLGPGYDAAFAYQNGVGAWGADAHESQVCCRALTERLPDERVTAECLARRLRTGHAWRGQQHSLATERARQPARQVGSVGFVRGVAQPAETLHDFDALDLAAARIRDEGVDHAEQR